MWSVSTEQRIRGCVRDGLETPLPSQVIIVPFRPSPWERGKLSKKTVAVELEPRISDRFMDETRLLFCEIVRSETKWSDRSKLR